MDELNDIGSTSGELAKPNQEPTNDLSNIIAITQTFFKKWEGFSPTPYWDYKQWSWGYGTRVPNSVNNKSVRPLGTITKAEAFNESTAHVTNDYNILCKLVKVFLKDNQWAAYLSFSYDLGVGNAYKLLSNINSGNNEALGVQWNQYVNAGGQVSSDLIERRKAEFALFNS
jgi:lysozyme